jgi:excisionase family DNA binding protein
MNPGTVNVPQLMSPDEAAAYLGVHVQTMHRWLKSGTVPGVRLGGRWFIKARTLADLLEPSRGAA